MRNLAASICLVFCLKNFSYKVKILKTVMVKHLSAILFLIGSILLFFFAFRIKKAQKRAQTLIGKYIGKMAFFSAIGMAIYSFMCFFFYKNSTLLGLFNIIGETFYLIAFVYGFSLFLYLIKPNLSQSKILKIGFFLIVVATISHFIFFPKPTVDYRGVLHFNAPPVPGLTYSLFSLAGILPLSFAFFREAIKKPYLRLKTLVLGIALLLIFIAGVLLSIFTQTFVYIFSFSLQTFGFFLLFLGALIKAKEEEVS